MIDKIIELEGYIEKLKEYIELLKESCICGGVAMTFNLDDETCDSDSTVS